MTQSGSSSNTWQGVTAAAAKAGARFPELVAAQWALESGWGKKTSGRNNFFGLKGSGSSVRTQEFVNGKWITITDGFIDFPDLETCVAYLVDRWYKDYKTYKGVNRAAAREDAARLLKREGYATDPDYPEKLISLMERNAPRAPVDAPQEPANPLWVPYFRQLDSTTDQARRMCFSSSCAMLVEFLRPGTLKGPNGDDQYLQIVRRYGDTTQYPAQLKALAHFGIKAEFTQAGDFPLLRRQIDKGIPVPCGWIHRGRVERPTGGGHYSIVIGHSPGKVIVHDPLGEPDLITGATLGGSGANLSFSEKNFGRRWMVEPAGGSYRFAPGKGWAVVAKG